MPQRVVNGLALTPGKALRSRYIKFYKVANEDFWLKGTYICHTSLHLPVPHR